jgi:hypothetical protein
MCPFFVRIIFSFRYWIGFRAPMITLNFFKNYSAVSLKRLLSSFASFTPVDPFAMDSGSAHKTLA